MSHHASDRWIERIHACADTQAARVWIQYSLDLAFQVPNRYAVDLWIQRIVEGRTQLARREGMRWYMLGYAVFIVSGNRVVTVIRATEDDVRIVLAWLLTGIWMP